MGNTGIHASSLTHFIDLAIEETELGYGGKSFQRLKEMIAAPSPQAPGSFLPGPLPSSKSNHSMIASKMMDILAEKIGLPTSDRSSAPPAVISSGAAVRIAVDIQPWLPDSVEQKAGLPFMNRLSSCLTACTRNRAICCQAGVTLSLLRTIQMIAAGDSSRTSGSLFLNPAGGTVDMDPLLSIFEILAGFSLTVGELREWMVTVSATRLQGVAMDLVLGLEKAMGREDGRGPLHTFEFDGQNSGLLGPGDVKWPFNNGYAFASWIFIESFEETEEAALSAASMAAAIAAAASAKVGRSSPMSAAAAASALAGEGMTYMPRLFSFVTAESQGGVEAFFDKEFLIMEVQNSRGKKTSFHFTHSFQPQKWYFVGLEHAVKSSGTASDDSEIRLYVNGHLLESRSLELPRIHKPLGFCCVATNPPAAMAGLQRRRRQCPLFAELGPVYIFREPIGAERMMRLASRGGDHVATFGAAAGVPWSSTVEQLGWAAEDSCALDAELGARLHLLYHPALLKGRFCQDISPLGVSGTRRRPGEMLGQVYEASRMRIEDAVWASGEGGPLWLLSAFASLFEKDWLDPSKPSPVSALDPAELASIVPLAELAPAVFRIMSRVIENPLNLEELAKGHSASAFAHLLRRLLLLARYLRRSHGGPGVAARLGDIWEEELVDSILLLVQAPHYHEAIKADLYALLLLDLKLWCHSNHSLQKKLLSQLADRVYADQSTFRAASAVPTLLDGCRRCYWAVKESISIEHSDQPLGVNEANALVDELLVLVELIVGAASPEDSLSDMNTLVRFCVDNPQYHQVWRVQLLTYRLLAQPNNTKATSVADNFVSSGGIDMLFRLLQKEAHFGESGSVQATAVSPGLDSTETPSSGGGGQSTADDSLAIAAIQVIGALLDSGHLKLELPLSTASGLSLMTAVLDPSFGQRNAPSLGTWLPYVLQACFKRAPERLMTPKLYHALMLAATKHRSTSWEVNSDPDVGPGELRHFSLLRPFLYELPQAPHSLQREVTQELLRLVSFSAENRSLLSSQTDWADVLVEILAATALKQKSGDLSLEAQECLMGVHNDILTVVVELLGRFLREDGGWKSLERSFHSLDWIADVKSADDPPTAQNRRQAVYRVKQQVLEALLHSALYDLSQQAHTMATAAANAASLQISPRSARQLAEQAVQAPMRLALNSLSLLIAVDYSLRCQTIVSPSDQPDADSSSAEGASALPNNAATQPPSEGISLETLKMMVDDSGQISTAAMEKITASTSAKPFSEVRDALLSYGSIAGDLHASWQLRSRMWFGVGLRRGASRSDRLGGAGSKPPDQELKPDGSARQFLSLALVRRASEVIEVLLRDDSASMGGLAVNGGATRGGEASEAALQAMDSDPVYFTLLRILLCAMREQDDLIHIFDSAGEGHHRTSDARTNVQASLLWRILQPLFQCPLLESMREKVLGTAAILYTEIYHSITPEREIIRPLYIQQIIPPFASLLRRWRPLLAGLPELTDAEGQSPLASEDRALASDAYPHQAALELLSPSWIACLASPPVAASLSSLSKATVAAASSFASCLRLPGVPTLALDTASPGISPSPSGHGISLSNSSSSSAIGQMDSHATAPFGDQKTAGGDSAGRRGLTERAKCEEELTFLWRLRKAMEHAWLWACDTQLDTRQPVTTISLTRPSRSFSSLVPAVSPASFTTTMAGLFPVKSTKTLPWMDVSNNSQVEVVSNLNQLGQTRLLSILFSHLDAANHMVDSERVRSTMSCAKETMRIAVGWRVWRQLVKRFIQSGGVDASFSNQAVKWKLDTMENSMRMRLRLKRTFQARLLTAPSEEQNPDPSASPGAPVEGSRAPEESPEPAGGGQGIPVLNKAGDAGPVGSPTAFDSPLQYLGREEDGGMERQEAMVALTAESVAVDKKEVMLAEIGATLVKPLKLIKGKLQVTSKRIIFLSDAHVACSSEGADLEVSYESVESNKDGHNRLWPISAVTQMFSRRYLLRTTALELFMADRSNYFFSFESVKEKDDAYRAILQAKPPRLSKSSFATQKPDQLFKRSQLCEKWVRREISNFEYLMALNTMAGRTFNDITQYPIFPWVIQDYSSPQLDLRDSHIYRDLTKPIGALNPDKLERVIERYHSYDDPIVPKFHYGSHYSNTGSVLYFLVRMEPFTSLATKLQGGSFDFADRLFHDIGATWQGVFNDMADVKELVPEFFYLPDMFTNHNGLELGSTQRGDKIGDVVLPPWASSPVDFVRKQRAALESEFVSASLHNWIDLIFGYKQRGRAAIEAHNMFYYMTYEGAVDIDAITDPVVRKSTQDQIAFFGQTPSQLLTTPHPRRVPLEQALHLNTVFRNPSSVKKFAVPEGHRLPLPAALVHATKLHITVLDMGAPACQLAMHRWQAHVRDASGNPFLFQPAKSNQATTLSNINSSIMHLLSSGEFPPDRDDRGLYPKAACLVTQGPLKPALLCALTPDGRFLFTGGHADNSVKLVSVETGRVLETAAVHCGPVTCLHLSKDGSTLVSGSRDSTLLLWRVHQQAFSIGSGQQQSLDGSPNQDPSLAAMASASGMNASSSSSSLSLSSPSPDSKDGITLDLPRAKPARLTLEGPLHVLRGHSSELACVAVCADLDCVASASDSRGVLLHSVVKGRFLGSLPDVKRADLIALSRQGLVVVWDSRARLLSVFTLNAALVSAVSVPPQDGNISSMAVSSDGLSLAVGTTMSSIMPQGSKAGPDYSSGDSFDQSKESRTERSWREGSEDRGRRESDMGAWVPGAAVTLLDIYTLNVLSRFRTADDSNVTALTLNDDNSVLICCTSSGQMFLYMDPEHSQRLSDEQSGRMWLPMVGNRSL